MAGAWNEFVAQSKQGTFLLDRNYMDYHSDRFTDHSLMVYNNGKLYALFPANSVDDTIWSHQGLTYGGLLTSPAATATGVRDSLLKINEWLKQENFKTVIYKPIPWIYHRLPAEEDLYFLYNTFHAQLTARYLSSTIRIANAPRWQRLRRRCVEKAKNEGIVVRFVDAAQSYADFWRILTDNLTSKYNVKPVHSLDEIRLLQSRFPKQIRLYAAYHDGIMIGGILFYLTPQVLHPQYSSATPEGNTLHALDAIYGQILSNPKLNEFTYFDFGNSNEQQGRYLNESLIFEKEGFGGRGVCYDWYTYNL